MELKIPELSLVVLIGASGSGKSTFARTRFGVFETVSSDFCRGLVSDDENDQTVSNQAFNLLHTIVRQRLELGRLTVVDATNVRPEDRKHLVAIAREFHVLPVALVFDVSEKTCQEQNASRPNRNFGPHVIRQQRAAMKRGLRGLRREGFRFVYTFQNAEEVEAAHLVRQPLWNNRRDERGPFDIIGDIHGCYDELIELLVKLGYDTTQRDRVVSPLGRKAVFLGDLVDRGPNSPQVLRLVQTMVEQGTALCVPGNHDVKLLRKLRGKNVQVTHGLGQTLEQLKLEPPEFTESTARFLDALISHYVLDEGRLVVAHAGLKKSMQGRGSGAVRDFCLYGETTGETDEFGLPIRHDWAANYRGDATVVYGHTPVPEPEWINQTINIDTGCVFGGKLTALRYPEREFVSVPSHSVYSKPARPFLGDTTAKPALSAQHTLDDVLDLADVFGKRIIDTGLRKSITIREGQSAAALEVMSRFAANPKWLIYLPPTMSPCETSLRDDYLEHPDEALAYYRRHGVLKVSCQAKHMGSRAVAIVCRDEEATRARFGVEGEGIGIIYTRTGRRFFSDRTLEQDLLTRVRNAMTSSGLWDELQTRWVCLDCELMPWSAKAMELLRSQYAAVGSSGRYALSASTQALAEAADHNQEATALLEDYRQRESNLASYVDAYRHYCWQVKGLEDLRLAPFHILASEGGVHTDRNHEWHMGVAKRLSDSDGRVLIATHSHTVDLADASSVEGVTQWWIDWTGAGGEGMVVKPMDWIVRLGHKLVQPAVKCRGREYLRIIYGPNYTQPQSLQRLKSRGLSRKRSLAEREFALGLEGLERFVRREPLRRIHECAFAVLALESEPVDPRL